MFVQHNWYIVCNVHNIDSVVDDEINFDITLL